jgi:hypothetical protein
MRGLLVSRPARREAELSRIGLLGRALRDDGHPAAGTLGDVGIVALRVLAVVPVVGRRGLVGGRRIRIRGIAVGRIRIRRRVPKGGGREKAEPEPEGQAAAEATPAMVEASMESTTAPRIGGRGEHRDEHESQDQGRGEASGPSVPPRNEDDSPWGTDGDRTRRTVTGFRAGSGGSRDDAGLCRPPDISMTEATDFGNLARWCPRQAARWACRPGHPSGVRGECARDDSRRGVRPEKADVFSGRQSHRGNSQTPRSLDGRAAGNQGWSPSTKPSEGWERVAGL